MKKILIISSFPAPYRVDVFKGLKKHFDIKIFFITDNDQNRNSSYFSGKDQIDYGVLSDPDDKIRFNHEVKNLRTYDLLMAYDWYLKESLKVEWKCIRMGIPYIINCDGAFLDTRRSFKNCMKTFVKRMFIRHAALCFSSGKAATQYFQYYGAGSERIKTHHFSSLHEENIIQNPISTKEKEILRRNLGLSDKKMILSVGQFIYRKGYDLLLEAWKMCDKKYQLVLIGGGELRAEYENKIAQEKYENVHLIDYLPTGKVFQYYQAADLFVLPTREDIWGLVVNEALAFGLPVISTERCNAAMELIKNDVNGSIVPTEDPVALSDSIIRFMKKTDKEISESAAHALKVIKGYTIEDVIKTHIRDIQTII